MKIVGEEKPQDCYELGLIMEYRLDKDVSRQYLEVIKEFGDLNVFEDREKPFFTFDKEYFFTIKGFVGADRIRAIYRPGNPEVRRRFLSELLGCDSPEKVKKAKTLEKKALSTMGLIDRLRPANP